MEKDRADNLTAITMDELVKMINKCTDEFIIHVQLGEERDSDGTEKSVQS